MSVEFDDLKEQFENLIIRYNELVEKSDRQREQNAMLEQSRTDIRSENERLKKENVQFKDAGAFAITILKSIRSDRYSAISDANNDSITIFLQKYGKGI
jgi:hypothetical protein